MKFIGDYILNLVHLDFPQRFLIVVLFLVSIGVQLFWSIKYRLMDRIVSLTSRTTSLPLTLTKTFLFPIVQLICSSS